MDLLKLRPIRAVLSSKYFPIVPQLFTLSAYAALFTGSAGVGYDSRIAGYISSTNLASQIVWTFWWSAVLVLGAVVGRVWCAICPLEFVNSIASRIGLKKKAPRFLRSGWVITLFYSFLLFGAGKYLGLQEAPRHIRSFLHLQSLSGQDTRQPRMPALHPLHQGLSPREFQALPAHTVRRFLQENTAQACGDVSPAAHHRFCQQQLARARRFHPGAAAAVHARLTEILEAHAQCLHGAPHSYHCRGPHAARIPGHHLELACPEVQPLGSSGGPHCHHAGGQSAVHRPERARSGLGTPGPYDRASLRRHLRSLGCHHPEKPVNRRDRPGREALVDTERSFLHRQLLYPDLTA